MKKYIINLSVLTLIIYLIDLAVFNTFLQKFYTPVWLFIPGLVGIITVIGHYLITRQLKRAPNKFTWTFMLISAIKMILFLVFLVIYLMINRDQAMPVLLGFFSIYIIYTVFEVNSLSIMVKKKAEN